MRGGRAALRARGGHGHVRRQPQHQRLEHLHGRLRVLRVRAVAPLAGRLRALRGGVRRGACSEAVEFGATEICMQSGIHPDWGLADYEKWLRVAKRTAPEIHLHAYSPMEVAHMCDVSGLSPRHVFDAPARGRAGLDAGHRGGGPARRRPRADLAQQAAGGALGRDHRGLPRRGDPLDRDRDVRPRRGAMGARRAHARRARAPGAHRRLHRVRAAVVHPVPHAARPDPRGRGDLARGEPQAHRGVPARARQDRPQPPGELGQDGARRRHRVAALGRQRPRRNADGGVDLADGRQLPRRQADAADLVAAAHRAGRPAAERTTLYEIRRPRHELPGGRVASLDGGAGRRRRELSADRGSSAVAVRRRRAARGVRRAARRHRHAHLADRVLRPDLRGDLPPDDDAASGDLHGRRRAPAGPRDRLLRDPVRSAVGDQADARQHADRAARAARGQGGRGVRADRGGGSARVREAARESPRSCARR